MKERGVARSGRRRNARQKPRGGYLYRDRERENSSCPDICRRTRCKLVDGTRMDPSRAPDTSSSCRRVPLFARKSRQRLDGDVSYRKKAARRTWTTSRSRIAMQRDATELNFTLRRRTDASYWLILLMKRLLSQRHSTCYLSPFPPSQNSRVFLSALGTLRSRQIRINR